jgi:Fe-S-cluster containining protein
VSAALPARVEHWLCCAEKRCCYDALVYLTGDEVARLARMLSVPPWEFTDALDAPDDADDGFALDGSGRRRRLALRRVHFPSEDAHCAFLLRLPSGSARCGLGDGRPAACRAFPLEGGNDACTCAWDGVPLDDDAGRTEIAGLAAERDRYATVVQSWNAYVAAQAEQAFTHRDFCRFLLDAYESEGR